MSAIDGYVMEQRKGKTLVELLRDNSDDGIGCCHSSLCEEAAAEIDRLQEVKRRSLAIADERAIEAVKARAEIGRLRAALECIAFAPTNCSGPDLAGCIDIARATLAHQQGLDVIK